MAGSYKQSGKLTFALLVLLAVCLFGRGAEAQYGGGTGTSEDPYLIYTAEQMNAIGEKRSDWGKGFKLMADIDLSNYDGKDGKPSFNIIAPDTGNTYWQFNGTPFTGAFDGNGHTISHLTSTGVSYLGLFGKLESGAEVKDLGVIDVNITGSHSYVGGLVGSNFGRVRRCYSTGVVNGNRNVGGLIGLNRGSVANCYSTAMVGGEQTVGGLVGDNNTNGKLTCCYSTGRVSGVQLIGGLVGWNAGDVTGCFWDTQTSEQDMSEGGTGKTTAEMQTRSTFLDAGWDFLDETANGTEDIWWILEGRGYPRLYWEPIEDGQTRANVYYVDAVNGDNNNDGLTLETAFATIQQGIDSAAHGDTVIVAPATYTGPGNRDLDFHGKAITVRSIDPNDQNVVAATIIDCQGREEEPHRGFYFHSGETLSSVLDGFTITGGYISSTTLPYPSSAGAIYCDNSSPTIANNIILSNYAANYGAIYCNNNSSPLIISNNILDNSSSSGGGGICCCGGSSPTIVNNTISENQAGYGAGICVWSSSPTIIGNIISNNSVPQGTEHSGGGIICLYSCPAVIQNNLIIGNIAGVGGGISVYKSSGPIITNNTITGNTANLGGGISDEESSLTVLNSILWNDSPDEIYLDDSSTIDITYSDIHGGWPGAGNINADPLFVNVANVDYHLQASSPCIDAGDNSAIPQSVVVDLDGNPRIINGTVDMGAYEVGMAAIPDEAKYGGGTGVPNDPYLIYTAEQMNAIGVNPNDWDKHFKLMVDIDLSAFTGTEFNIIGTSYGNSFAGVFDGNGKKIYNFSYTSTDRDYVGLFGYVYGPNAEIKDLGLIDPNVNAGTGDRVGSLVGYLSRGNITGCYVEGGSVLGNERVGGLVGYNYRGTITDCSATGDVSGDWYVGGLVGYNYSGTIADCSATGSVLGDRYVGSLVGFNDNTIINCSATGIVSGDRYIGGLVGANEGSITNCSATSSVSGMTAIGGLVGYNSDTITNCYAKGDSVTGYSYVGGLVGYNRETITNCYATSIVSGDRYVGGFVGDNLVGRITDSFWDIEASGQTLGVGLGSDDGISGKNMAEMQSLSTFIDVGWDFRGESANGTEDIWWILEGQGYPMFVWELWASSPNPQDGATSVFPPLILRWRPGGSTLYHDIYLGEDEDTVANATTLSLGIYRGQQPREVATYDPGTLEWGKTYYWRIDEYNTDEIISKGNVWSFTTADFILIDDFDDYNDYTPDEIFSTWIVPWDLPVNGAQVGHFDPPFAETEIVHGGSQSMPLFYDNSGPAYYSEATMTPISVRNWTEEGVGVLSLWFYGDKSNVAEPMYVVLNRYASVYHDNPDAVLIEEWTEWTIDLQEFAAQGVNLANVNTLSIGFGDKDNLQAGGSGLVFFDDIRLYPELEPAP